MSRLAGAAAAGVLFVLLATANSGGYRYGASDQAFYGPAVALRIDPTLFPRDRVLFAPQMRAWLADDLFAGLARATGAQLPAIFFITYVVTLLLFAAAAAWFVRGLGGSAWMAAAALLLLTFRHQITRTGANSLEGYMHPRVLAFALGVWALGGAVRRRFGMAALAILAAAVFHPTTALWFSIVVGVAVAVALFDRLRATAGPASMAAAGLSLLTPPVLELGQMDSAWLAVLAEKSYLFPSGWPLSVWAVNLAYPVVLILIYRQRVARGATVPGERGLVAGLLALVALFLISVPFSAARVALAVQLQIGRVFWLLDFAVGVYVAWWLMSGRAMQAPGRRAALLGVLGLLSIARGTYVLAVETSRPLAQMSLPATPWTEAMTWIASRPTDVHVLADPAHAWKYGVGVRQAAARDTFLETVKDSAMAMYDREVAMRVAERSAALSRFDEMTTEDVRALDSRYGFDLFVVEDGRSFALPVLYRNARFVIYDLR